MLKGRK